MKITTIGIDLAKEVFQIHGVNEYGKVMLLKQLRRNAVAGFFCQFKEALNKCHFEQEQEIYYIDY